MKKVSISRRTLNSLERNGYLFKTAEACQKHIDEFGLGEVAEAYEMEGEQGYPRTAYNIFRGYVING